LVLASLAQAVVQAVALVVAQAVVQAEAIHHTLAGAVIARRRGEAWPLSLDLLFHAPPRLIEQSTQPKRQAVLYCVAAKARCDKSRPYTRNISFL